MVPLLSVIIPAFNAESTIKHCINSLQSQSYPKNQFEIIVVDDGSTDRTVEFAKEAGADKVIATKHLGTSQTRKKGFNEARGKILCSLDSDCESKDGWLQTITKELENLDAISGPIENGIKNSSISWAEYLLEFSEFNEHKPRSEIRFLPGCNQAMRRNAYESTSGFSQVQSSDDVFFGESLQRAGIKCYFVPEMKIIHLGTTDIEKFLSKFKRRGSGFFNTRKQIPNAPYSFIVKSKLLIPILFVGIIFYKTCYAIKAKNLRQFITSFPIILRGIFSFCKGVINEM